MHLSGFPNEKKISKVLSEIEPRKLFTWNVGLNKEHGDVLISLFYKHYAHRQLGTIFFPAFKNWVEARYFETWHQKYAPLFKSVLEVNNENWDTEEVSTEYEIVDKNTLGRRSQFNQGTTAASFNKLTSGNAQQDSAGWLTTGGRTRHSQSQLNKANSQAKNLAINDDLNTQTPQTTTLSQPALLPEPTQEALQAGTGAAVWNDGFLTEATRHNQSGWANEFTTSGSDECAQDDNIQGTLNGQSANQWDQTAEQNSTQTGNMSVMRGTQNSIEGVKITRKKSGRQQTLAMLMNEFRATLLPINHMWIKEFDSFFLEIF